MDLESKHYAIVAVVAIICIFLWNMFGANDPEAARIRSCTNLASYAQQHQQPEPSCVKDTLSTSKK